MNLSDYKLGRVYAADSQRGRLSAAASEVWHAL